MTTEIAKGCEVKFENTREQISMELVFKKKNQEVDICDFFHQMLMEMDYLEVSFRKGRYTLAEKKGNNLLGSIKKIIDTFLEFYEGSYRTEVTEISNRNSSASYALSREKDTTNLKSDAKSNDNTLHNTRNKDEPSEQNSDCSTKLRPGQHKKVTAVDELRTLGAAYNTNDGSSKDKDMKVTGDASRKPGFSDKTSGGMSGDKYKKDADDAERKPGFSDKTSDVMPGDMSKKNKDDSRSKGDFPNQTNDSGKSQQKADSVTVKAKTGMSVQYQLERL